MWRVSDPTYLQSLNYRDIKTNILLKQKFGKNITMNFEAGYAYFRRLDLIEGGKINQTTNIAGAPYVGAAFNFKFGQSLLMSKAKGLE